MTLFDEYIGRDMTDCILASVLNTQNMHCRVAMKIDLFLFDIFTSCLVSLPDIICPLGGCLFAKYYPSELCVQFIDHNENFCIYIDNFSIDCYSLGIIFSCFHSATACRKPIKIIVVSDGAEFPKQFFSPLIRKWRRDKTLELFIYIW